MKYLLFFFSLNAFAGYYGGGSGSSSGSGTVTSVSASVPSVLSVSGVPITSSGTIALSYSGTALPVANGGTAATTAAGARTSLGAVGLTGNESIAGDKTLSGTTIHSGVSQFAASTFTSTINVSGMATMDGTIAVNSAIGLRKSDVVALTADNQVVTVSKPFIPVTSNNADPTTRTIVLGQGGTSGQILVLLHDRSTTGGCEIPKNGAINGGGTMRLSTDWTPAGGDTLTLIWDGSSDWYEIARSIAL